MKFSINREALLKPLQTVSSVVEKRQTLPVLSNLLVRADENGLHMTGTDLEVELNASAVLDEVEPGEITIPARKFHEICKSLPDATKITLTVDETKVQIKAGKSRYTLTSLPAMDFPLIENFSTVQSFSVQQGDLKRLIDKTAFAMAQQDVRYYLNGLLLELQSDTFRTVATDGHRLACCDINAELPIGDVRKQLILPRKAVLELVRILDDEDQEVQVDFGENHFRLRKGGITFISKLIDGKFPEYEAVIPLGANHIITTGRLALMDSIRRAAILSNEKYRGIKLEAETGLVRIIAHNPEQEEAVEELEVDYNGESLTIGFNYAYLLDALGALEGDQIHVCLKDNTTSCLVKEMDSDLQRHIIMPLKL